LRRGPPSELFAPAPLAAAALLALNDHVLKARLHNVVTGKLSDLALCFLLPLLLSALLRPLWRQDRARLAAAAAVAGLLFTVLELSAGADAWVSAVVASVGRPFGLHAIGFTRDLSDLVALAVVPLAYLYGRRRLARPPTAWLAPLAVRASALGGMLLVLAADEIEGCTERAAAVTFKVEGDCGPTALIVVEPHEEGLTVYNSVQAVGVMWEPSAYNTSAGANTAGGGYSGCPAQLTQGNWYFSGSVCGSADAGATEETKTDAGVCGAGQRTCQAKLEDGTLWLTCVAGAFISSGDAGARCRSRLTAVDP